MKVKCNSKLLAVGLAVFFPILCRAEWIENEGVVRVGERCENSVLKVVMGPWHKRSPGELREFTIERASLCEALNDFQSEHQCELIGIKFYTDGEKIRRIQRMEAIDPQIGGDCG